MGAFNLCRKYVNALPKGQLFGTRELLSYGNRATIDKCTQAMVGSGMVLRMARGVFVRNDDDLKIPTVEAIACTKARLFGKFMIPSEAAQAAEWGLEKVPIKRRKRRRKPPKKVLPTAEFTFAVLGTTSSFETIHGYVKLKHQSARKFFVAQHDVGKLLAAIWHAGEDANPNHRHLLQMANFSPKTNRRFHQLCAWVPEWVHENFRSNEPGMTVHAPWQLYPHTKIEFPPTKPGNGVREEPAVYAVGAIFGARMKCAYSTSHDVRHARAG